MMELVIGGFSQGKTDYVKRNYHLKEDEIFDAEVDRNQRDALEDMIRRGQMKCILHFHLLVKDWLMQNRNPEQEMLSILSSGIEVITADEIGYGIVPVDKKEREYREITGRLCCRLAEHAELVTRVVCGIPTTIKSNVAKQQWIFLRHGMTKGNIEKRYIGKTDEGLCEEGKKGLYDRKNQGLYGKLTQCEICIVSPMRRCLETADILCPDMEKLVIDELREMDFGIFENKNFVELKDCKEYKEWVEQNSLSKIPQGEGREEFEERIWCGMRKAKQMLQERKLQNAVFMVHGGTIMAYLSRVLNQADRYYEFCPKHGEGYSLLQSVSAGSYHFSVNPFCL